MDRFTAPEFDRAGLLTIDVQKCTLDGQSFEIPGTTDVLPYIANLAGVFRSVARPIVHVVRLYKPDGSNADLCRREMLENGAELVLVGSDGRLPAPEILPRADIEIDDEQLLSGALQEIGPHEWLLYKPRWGAFYRTVLEEHLRSLGVSTIALGGCNYPNCPRTTLYQASERDFRLIAIADGISRFDEKGSRELEGIGVSVMNAEDCGRAIQAASTG